MIPREENKDNGGRPAATIVEALYNAGKMPDKFYYQLNGKSVQENYMSWKAAEQNDDLEVDRVEFTSTVVVKNAK